MTAAPNSSAGLDALIISSAPVRDEEQQRRALSWTLIRRIFTYLWRYPRLQFFIILQAVLVALLNSSIPVVVAEAIRWTIEQPERLRHAANLSPAQGLMLASGAIVALAAVYHFLMGWRIFSVNRLTERVVFDLRHDLFTHVQSLDMAYFDRTKLGRILSRGTSDISAMRNAVAQVIPRTLISLLIMAFMFALMVRADWVLALLLVASAPVILRVNSAFRSRMEDSYRAVQESYSRLTANIAETVAGIRVTQGFAREAVNAGLFRNLLAKHRANNMRAAVVHGLYSPVFDLCFQALAVACLVVGAWRMASGDMAVADLIGFLMYAGAFFGVANIIVDLFGTTMQAMAGAERFFGLLDTRPTITEPTGAVPLPSPGEPGADPGGARVAFRGVTFGYDPARPVLLDVSFEAQPGQTVALVGHTGSGKTSIINLVCRLYEWQTGAITIDGVDLRGAQLASLRRQTGMVSQDNFLFDGTVMDNVRFARPEATDKEVLGACEALGCLDLFLSLRDGLETTVGERGTNLSLGQRQLVCFARAMLADPRLLILDEATSAVDTYTEHRIQQALDRLMRGRTSLVVAHRLSTIRHADQILVLDHGRIIERGSHGQLMIAGGHYASLYNEFIRLLDDDQ